jgi:hypothetical protein
MISGDAQSEHGATSPAGFFLPPFSDLQKMSPASVDGDQQTPQEITTQSPVLTVVPLFEPLSQCPLDVTGRGQVVGQQFGLAFDGIRTSQRRNTEVRLTPRWRKADSNPRSRSCQTLCRVSPDDPGTAGSDPVISSGPLARWRWSLRSLPSKFGSCATWSLNSFCSRGESTNHRFRRRRSSGSQYLGA